MAAHTTELSSQGIVLHWGSADIGVTRLSYSGSSAGEIDITSMGSTSVTDPNFSNHKLMKKSVDYSVIDLGEISCDFFGPCGFDIDDLGTQRSLSVDGLNLTSPAFLTAMSTEVVAGELVRGSCTFKLSNE
jgi:hypothetical protein